LTTGSTPSGDWTAGIGLNPMITIMALARRVARTISAEG
jgi:hypothetical protein